MLRISNTKIWSVKYAKAIQLTPELQQIIADIQENIPPVLEMMEKHNLEKYDLGYYAYFNPYAKQKEYMNILIQNLDNVLRDEPIADHSVYTFDEQQNYEGEAPLKQGDVIHKIRLTPKTLNENKVFLALSHEFVHAIDPKRSPKFVDPKRPNYNLPKNMSPEEYVRAPTEVDALSRNMIDIILKKIEKNEIDESEVREWMNNPSTHPLRLLEFAKKIFPLWTPEQQKTFLQRLYHELENKPQSQQSQAPIEWHDGTQDLVFDKLTRAIS